MTWMEEVFLRIQETVFQSMQKHIHVAMAITGVVLLCALLQNFDIGGMEEGIAKSTFFVEYGMIAVVIGDNMVYAQKLATEAMEHMVTAVNTVSPILLVAAPGMSTTFLLATGIVSNGFKLFFLPAICLIAALSLVDNLSTAFSISHLVDFLKKGIFWGMSFVMTVYFGVLSVQTCLITAEGTAAQKTAKFAVSAWPVVGQYLAESFDAVSASAAVIHTTTGTGTMIGILTICLAPALEMLLLAGVLKLVAALTQPVADARICNCIGSTATAISFMAGLITVCAVMLTITIGIFLTGIGKVRGG